MARLSKRSFAAVCTFMLSAFAISAVISPDNKAFAHGTAWLRQPTKPSFFNRWLGFGCSFIFVIPACYALYNLLKKERKRRSSLILLEKRASVRFPKIPMEDLTAKLEKEDNSQSQSFKVPKKSYGTEKPVTAVGEDEESQGDGGVTPDIKDEKKGETEDTPTEKSASDDVDEEKKWEEMRAIYTVASQKLADGKIAPAAFAACLFALGLAISQMVLPSKVLGFLALYTLADGRSFDPTLLTVMVGGAVVSFLSYQFVDGWGLIKNPWARNSPFSSSEFCVPKSTIIDWKLLLGALCFGIGWALAGLCPGPATFLAGSGTKPVLAFWWPFYYIGAFIAQKLKDKYP